MPLRLRTRPSSCGHFHNRWNSRILDLQRGADEDRHGTEWGAVELDAVLADYFQRLWIELLILHPKADITREVFDSDTEFERYVSERRSKGRASIRALGDIYVKSLQEQSIANWLWLNSVEFEYEKQVAIGEGSIVATQKRGRFVHQLMPLSAGNLQ